MNKNFVVIILVVLALTLSACGGAPQSASTEVPTPAKNAKRQTQQAAAQQAQASATIDPNATVDPMEQLNAIATQTALALQGNPVDELPPIDGEATVTPIVVEQPTIDPSLPSPTPNQPVVAQPTVQTVRPATYTLQKGEFIYCIARRFNVDVKQTLDLNGLFDSEILNPGLTVKIPATGNFSNGARALRAHPATYTVQGGDSIYSIACLYGDVDPMNIAAVNGLAAPYNLTVGAQLQIP